MDKSDCAEQDLSSLSDIALLSLHSKILSLLHARGVLRTKNNPVGDYAEWRVANAFGMTLLPNSAAGADALDKDGKRVQIKARRVTPENPSRQLSVLRNYEQQDFDYLIAVIFNEQYAVTDAWQIPHAVIEKYVPHRDHVNGRVIILKGKILLDDAVTNVTSRLIADEISDGTPPETRIDSPAVPLLSTVELGGDSIPKALSEERLSRYIKAIGMECFVKYYPLFVDIRLSTVEVIERVYTGEGYTEKSCNNRVRKARKIIESGLGISALEKILASERIDDSVKRQAQDLIRRYG